MSLKGKKVLVTGASRGLGLAIARSIVEAHGGAAEDLEAGMGQGVRHDADLDAHRLVFDRIGEVKDLGAGQLAPLRQDRRRQVRPAEFFPFSSQHGRRQMFRAFGEVGHVIRIRCFDEHRAQVRDLFGHAPDLVRVMGIPAIEERRAAVGDQKSHSGHQMVDANRRHAQVR